MPNPEATLINALNTLFASVLGAESFHADVHAGNPLALRDGRVVFIDFRHRGARAARDLGRGQCDVGNNAFFLEKNNVYRHCNEFFWFL